MRLECWIRLANVAGLGVRDLHALLREFGSPEAVVAASRTSLEKFVRGDVAAGIHGSDAAAVESALRWSEVPGNHLLSWDDPDYPRALLDIGEAPFVLYYKGQQALLNAPALAMVGSRNASPAGIRNAEEFAATLADAGLTIVSGLALGIDAAAHRGALRSRRGADTTSGSTIAVIGTGIDRIYPPRNRDLAHEIAERGGILSEFALGTPPYAGNFPRRNRLISVIAQGVLVVEATPGSGSLITARLAGEQGREVFAIPGSIHSPFSKGCHKLIKEGAKLVESAQDVLEELNRPAAGSGAARGTMSPGRRSAALPADADSRALLDALGFDPATPDELCARLNWPAEHVLALLLQLELAGSLAQSSGGKVQRLA